MATTFVPVITAEDQEVLAELAGTIWREYWPDRIGADQTEYMVEQFQSLGAIRRDMAKAEEPYEYWFVVSDTADGRGGEARAPHIVGYTGGHDEGATNRFFISKIYLLAEERGKGYASRVIDFYEGLCRERGFRAMYLTVKRDNELAIRAYRGQGFETVELVDKPIGNGFYMYDNVMAKEIK